MEAERHMLEPRHGAVALLGTLRDLGIKIGLLSDCTPEILDLWSELPYATLVDCAVRSCDVRWRKPAPLLIAPSSKVWALMPPNACTWATARVLSSAAPRRLA
jgi:hypothetical protein